MYGETVFVVLKAADYIDHQEIVHLSQIMVFLGADFLITVRHGESETSGRGPQGVGRCARTNSSAARSGVLHAILDRVVDDYGTVIRFVDVDIEEVEHQVFSNVRENVAERIYRLKREVLEFRQAVVPFADPRRALAERPRAAHGGRPPRVLP